MSNILSNEKNFKAMVAFGVSASIDKFIYKSPNIKNTLILASVALKFFSFDKILLIYILQIY